MRCLRTARVLFAAIAVAWIGIASAQDMYVPAGRWLDDQGRPYQLERLHGTPTVITMAYGACRRVCSASLCIMEQLQELSDARRLDVNFVVVGIDPQEDRPRDWADYRAFRKLNRPNWYFLTGDDPSTQQLARRLGVRYWHYGEHTVHDLRVVLLSTESRVLRSIDAFGQNVEALLP